jgi:acetolactate synthase-1/2/3 large subunit
MVLVAKKLVDRLVKHGVKKVFGYPGGAILPVLDALHGRKDIQYVLTRTELGAGFMAQGYARSQWGSLGVVMTTSGPGALNIMTSLQDALSDGTPLLALTGQVSTAVLGTDAFQEADVVGVSRSCTKWNTMIRDGSLADETVTKAVRTAFNGRWGPVLLDLPKNIMSASVADPDGPDGPCLEIDDADKIESSICASDIMRLLKTAKRPVILAGHGVLQAGPDAVANLQQLSLKYDIPVTTTLLGLGAYNETLGLSLKMVGMHGSYYANMAVQNCDLLLNFGSRFDDRITGLPSKFAPHAKIVHVDICAKNINKVIKTPYFINDSCGPVLHQLTLMDAYDYQMKRPLWTDLIDKWRAVGFSWAKDRPALQGSEVIATLNTLLFQQTTIVADVGAHQMWAAQFITYDYGRVRFMTSGGLGSMGFAVPAAIGAAMGGNAGTVICICGDGGFTMSFVELLTAVENKVNVKILVINNSAQLMVKMWQDKFYDKRHVGVAMNNPPFEKVCEAMGCKTLRIDSRVGLSAVLQEFLDWSDGPIVANVITDSSEAVLPMVSPGKALDDMIIAESDDQFSGDAPC